MVKFNKYISCNDCFNPTFKEFKLKPMYVQKSAYIHYLKNIFMFPQSMFQRN